MAALRPAPERASVQSQTANSIRRPRWPIVELGRWHMKAMRSITALAVAGLLLATIVAASASSYSVYLPLTAKHAGPIHTATAVPPTPTVTTTETLPPTGTCAPTQTATATPTATRTGTPTSTATATLTHTASPTPTSTATPTATQTPTPHSIPPVIEIPALPSGLYVGQRITLTLQVFDYDGDPIKLSVTQQLGMGDRYPVMSTLLHKDWNNCSWMETPFTSRPDIPGTTD